MEVAIGPEILSSLGPPLALLLTSARWFSWKTAAVYRKLFQQIYTRLVDEIGSGIVDFVSFLAQTYPLLLGDQKGRIIDGIVSELQERWLKILNICHEQRSILYNSEQLRPHVLKAFGAPCAGWVYARYHSPDVMIAADSVEAIQQGQYQLVMGELHATANTLAWQLFVNQHPSPEELFLAIDLDLPEPRLAPLIPTNFLGTIRRVHPVLESSKDFRLELVHSPTNAPKSQVLPSSEMVVENRGQGLIVRTRDGAICFDIIEAFADILTLLLHQRFKILPPVPHTPRIIFDNFVVCRESWNFAASDMEFAFLSDSADRFVSVRRWTRARNIPRFAFIKAPVEKKPVYVDFDSPIYVDIFARIVRRTAESNLADQPIGVTEMLPRIDQAWLPGPNGERYTSELRIVTLDLATRPGNPA